MTKALLRALCLLAAIGVSLAAFAAPDEEALGRARAYPVAPRPDMATGEAYRVGSFSAMDSLGPHCTLPPSADPLPLPRAAAEPVLRYRFGGASFTLDDYLQHQRATAVLVLKDGEILAERYQYERQPTQRMVSHSMAKTIVALAVGKALEESRIRSLEDRADRYAPGLEGTLYGETRLENLLRMASGARFVEDYSGQDDLARFNQAMLRRGSLAAARTVTERAVPQGERFNYASAETQMLGLVLRAATGDSLCRYVAQKIWQPMGAESAATWMVNSADQSERAAGGFNATVRDYARLGWLLANDGRRGEQAIIPADYLLRMTEATRQPEGFRPGRMSSKGSSYLGYGFQVWLLPGSTRRFVLLGVYGQALYVDPALKLVMVHMAVAKDASGDASGARMGAERDALWRGIVARYGAW